MRRDFYFFSLFSYIERTRPTVYVSGSLASFTSLLVRRHDRENEVIGTVVGLLPKNYLRNGMRTGLHYVISLSVCCRPISLIAGAARDRFAQTGRLQERASLGYHVGLVSSHDRLEFASVAALL